MEWRKIRVLILYIVLTFFAVVVLMPFFWMIITAFKQPGQALKVQFFPKKVISTGKLEVKDYDYTGMTGVIFEFIDKEAASVSVAGSFNGWKPGKNNLMHQGAGVWSTFVSIDPGEYEYKFVVNESDWRLDPYNKATKNGNSVIVVKPGEIVTNKPLSTDIRVIDGKLKIRYYSPDITDMWVTIGGKRYSLSRDDEGYWSGEFPLGENKSFELFKKRKFTDALKSMYTGQNFIKVLKNKDFPFGRFFLNSLVVAGGAGLLTVILCTMAGYAFSKKHFWFRDELFWMLFGTMLIPGMIFMVPQFAIVTKLRWINTYQGMIVPHLGNVFGLYLMRQYIDTIPDSLFESAKIDGASEWQVFTKIVVPLSVPVMITLFLLVFIGQWSNFLWQLIVNTPDSPLRTLPVGLALFKGQYGVRWEMLMAGACFSIFPITVLFLFAQRFFIEGITGGAVKE